MVMKHKLALAHMQSALIYAELSHCERKKVGCVVVRDNTIISIGYNGTPPGWDNCCEDEHGNSKPEVIHAELNAIAKLAAIKGGGKDASVFITCSPCIDCAVLLAAVGVREVYYAEDYVAARSTLKSRTGLGHLAQCGIPTYHLPIKQK